MMKHPVPETDAKELVFPMVLFSLIAFYVFCVTYTSAGFGSLATGFLSPSEPTNLDIFSNQTQPSTSESLTRARVVTNLTQTERLNATTLYLNVSLSNQTESVQKPESVEPRVAVCLVGGARRFEITGPSLLDKVVNAFNNSDLFLHSPLDENSYKFSLLKDAKRIAAVKIFEQMAVPETEEQRQVLTAYGSPSGLQGLLRYFNLVEGCLNMIDDYQSKNQIQYDWIVRTRVDGYWSAPLSPSVFMPGTYVVPSGSSYMGLNDRFGAGDLNTSRVALARLSLIPQIFRAGYRGLNSETAFKLQLVTEKIQFQEIQIPFCVMSERRFLYPPFGLHIPVVSITNPGPLSGAYCRPCKPACKGKCASDIFQKMDHHFNWVDGDPELCDAHRSWESGWRTIFDRVAGKKYMSARKRVESMDLDHCIVDLELMRSRAGVWDSPSPSEICRFGLRKGMKH